jgi:hypothetical protein
VNLVVIVSKGLESAGRYTDGKSFAWRQIWRVAVVNPQTKLIVSKQRFQGGDPSNVVGRKGPLTEGSRVGPDPVGVGGWIKTLIENKHR